MELWESVCGGGLPADDEHDDDAEDAPDDSEDDCRGEQEDEGTDEADMPGWLRCMCAKLLAKAINSLSSL